MFTFEEISALFELAARAPKSKAEVLLFNLLSEKANHILEESNKKREEPKAE